VDPPGPHLHSIQAAFTLPGANWFPSQSDLPEVHMKSTLRSQLAAAAMLLVPVGAMFTASPAAARTFLQDVIIQIANENQRRADVDAGRIPDYGPDHRGVHYGRDGYGRDHQAPQIVAVSPANGSRVDERGRTQIVARLDERGSGVAAVTLRVDGRDVSHRTRVEGNEVRYAENLQPGRHVAELVVRDRAGNATRRNWSFDVVDHDRGRGYGRDQGYGYGYGRDDGYGRRW
jgi:hypothetical protein